MSKPSTSLHTRLAILKDVLIREPKMIWKYYRPFRFMKTHDGSCNIYMADGRTPQGGMFDRLKGIISVYAVSKSQNKDFRIHFTTPFRLEDYLVPNEYDWRIADEDIHCHYPQSRPLFIYGEYEHPRRLLKHRKRETHFYYGYNSLSVINAHFHQSYKWDDLYHELFKPTPQLQQYIDYYRSEIGESYIAIHTRFLNLLGDKMEYDINPELSPESRQKLLQLIGDKAEELIQQYGEGRKVLIASDSATFVEYMQQRCDNLYVIPGAIKHVGTADAVQNEDVVKMFLDYYLIGSADKIFSLVGEGMWPSAFPEYAAKIGGGWFIRINV